MVRKTVAEINQYEGTTVNPMQSPEQVYELYSVPSFDTEYPEIIAGADIGSSKVTVQEGDVLICKINPRINRVWVVKHNTEHPLLASSEWIVVRNPGMDSDYLRWYFSSPTFRTLLNSEVAGIGGSLTRAQPKRVAQYTVPICPFEEQQRISASLNQVESLISLRKQQIAKLDELVKARFVEMFGDPVSNQKKWPLFALGSRCELITGNTPSRAESENYGDFIEWIKSDNINTPNTYLTTAQEGFSEIGYKKGRSVEAGSILMTCIAGSISCIGNVAIADRKVAFNQQINAIVPKQDEVLFLYWLMLLAKPIIHSPINMSLKGILSKGQLSEMKFPIPPLDLQHQFAAFVAQTDQQKLTIQHSLAQLELLKKALMQKYFG